MFGQYNSVKEIEKYIEEAKQQDDWFSVGRLEVRLEQFKKWQEEQNQNKTKNKRK
jgi:DNA-binding PadR family transcriptional regulator